MLENYYEINYVIFTLDLKNFAVMEPYVGESEDSIISLQVSPISRLTVIKNIQKNTSNITYLYNGHPISGDDLLGLIDIHKNTVMKCEIEVFDEIFNIANYNN